MVEKVVANGFKTMDKAKGLAHGFKSMYGGDVVMLFPNKIQNIICRP